MCEWIIEHTTYFLAGIDNFSETFNSLTPFGASVRYCFWLAESTCELYIHRIISG